MGAGFDLNFINIDISYLFSASNVRNPLENTIRFSVALQLDSTAASPIDSSTGTAAQ